MPKTQTGTIPQWTLSDRLAKARDHARIDQDDLAREMGVSRQSISNWERGYAKPKRPYVWAWADVTGVDRDWLLTGDAPDSEPDQLPRLDSNQQPFDCSPDVIDPFDPATTAGSAILALRKQIPLKVTT
jgi:transcriptional regulator with XRE-family HTH domain